MEMVTQGEQIEEEEEEASLDDRKNLIPHLEGSRRLRQSWSTVVSRRKRRQLISSGCVSGGTLRSGRGIIWISSHLSRAFSKTKN